MTINKPLSALILFWAWRQCIAQTLFVDFLPREFTASDMNWVDKGGIFLQSLSGNFQAGFGNIGDDKDDYYLCVFLKSKTVVWTANRNSPVHKDDNFNFRKDGNLELLKGQAQVFSTGTNGTDAQTLQLQDTGNLVLRDSKNRTLWQSFDFPTDTLLPGQKFLPNMKLVSNNGRQSLREGLHSLKLDAGSLSLVVNLGGPQQTVTYWTLDKDTRVIKGASGSLAFASLNLTKFVFFSSDGTPLRSLVFPGNSSADIRWLVLESDGNLRTYFTNDNVLSNDFTLITDPCTLPNTCGPYGICGYQQCRCPASLRVANSSDPTKGCRVPPVDPCNMKREDLRILDLDADLSYFANKYESPITTADLAGCKSLCMQNCSCNSGFFQASTRSCYLYQTQRLGNFEFLAGGGYSSFIKTVPGGSSSNHVVIYAIVGCSLVLILAAVGAFGWWYRRRWAASREDEEEFLDAIPGLPTRFTYRQLQVATGNFSKKLGGGGFGSVYEGTLVDKTKVAVKQLESIGQGKKEFRAEVATIGSIHHVNLVRLRGFCSEGNHRLLVYEFLARSSLDKSLFHENKQGAFLDWETRYNIAIGTVRGLAYLHEDCRERIIHCDIKPENILLDEHFTAKVSDFGLAKLVNKEQSHVFTTMRGTRGYLAPEWLLNTAISEKSDVYSFGMVLLELISGRKNFDPNETSEKWYIPAYAFKQAEVGKLADLLDSRLVGLAEEKQVVNAVRIALWCIQEDVHLRPSTGRVLQMLEGNIMVPDPPLSSQFAVRLHDRMVDAVSERDRYSVDRYSDYNSEDLLSASYLSGPR